jgi:hypothetical protein
VDNPYASPTNESAALPRITLYSPGHIAWATFLGAPIAGCVLLALNYKRFGDATSATLALIFGLIGTVVLLAIAFVLPDNFPNSVLPAAYTFGMFQCAKSLQGDALEHRLANGATKGSGWAAAGIGILCLAVLTVASFAIVLVAPEEWFGEELSSP